MKLWVERPKEEANLLNPAFCCSVLTASVFGYNSIEPKGMPFPLAFMVLPITLHKRTREALPINIRTSIADWLEKNPDAKIQYHERVISLIPFVREALLFGLDYKWFDIKEGRLIETMHTKPNVIQALKTSKREIAACIKQSKFVGRWFASAGSVQTVMTLWGIRP